MVSRKGLIRQIREKFSDKVDTETAARIVDTLMESMTEEWGIAYHDTPDTRKVDPIKREQAARGIFRNYGEPGDSLVKRHVLDWETVEEKNNDGIQ